MNPYHEQTHSMPHNSSYLSMELGNALRSNDESMMWSIVEGQQDQDEAFKALATLVPRNMYKAAGRTHFSEMFVMPVIVPGGAGIIDNAKLIRSSAYAINEALESWLNPKLYDTKTLFSGIKSYDAFSLLRPTGLRQYLYRTMPGQPDVPVNQAMQEIELPPQAPRLGFFNLVLTSQKGWPRLPAANTPRDTRLKQVVSFALSSDPHMPQAVVLTPERMQFAVPDAIALWLVQLDEVVGIAGWSATLVKHTADVVKITLLLKDEKVKATQFVVRKHQVGAQGLQDILSVLGSIAAFYDQANDMAVATKKCVELDLTQDEDMV